MDQKLEINRTLRNYSSDSAEQTAYEAMQAIGFQIAELLLAHPRGTMTTAIQGHAHWVSPVDGKIELLCTPDFAPLETHSNVFFVSDYDGLSAQDLMEMRESMLEWLRTPKFLQRDADSLDKLTPKSGQV